MRGPKFRNARAIFEREITFTRSGCEGIRISRESEAQGELRPSAREVLDRDRRGMVLHNPLHDGEPEPRAVGTSPVAAPEALEDQAALFDRNARPAVTHAHRALVADL